MESAVWLGVAVVALLGLALILNRSFTFRYSRTEQGVEAGLQVVQPDPTSQEARKEVLIDSTREQG